MKFKYLTVPCLALALAAAQPAAAQSDGSELSADELRQLFLKQKTRGLVIAPTAPANAPAEGTATAAATTVAPVAPEQHIEIDQDLQINVAVKFDFDSAALRADQKPKLTNLCTVLSEAEGEVFRIIGHTDSSGSAAYNERLSLLRAQEVKRHFMDECGVPDERLQAVGVGEEHPLNKDNPRADENRRVEFQILS